jgi:hypothetical protein
MGIGTHAGRCTVVNNLDGHLQFECPRENQFISHITSVHDNHREDRVFDMSCADFPIDVDGLVTSCTWTGTTETCIVICVYVFHEFEIFVVFVFSFRCNLEGFNILDLYRN